jgi:hypothetical protein
MRTWTFAAALLLLTGCTASISIGTDASSSSPPESAAASSASSGAPTSSAPSAPASAGASAGSSAGATAQPTLGPGFTLVSANLASPGLNGFSAVTGESSTVVAATYTNLNEDMDAGLVYSTDGGMTWTSGGKVALPGNQRLNSVMLTDQGAVLVGSTSEKKGDHYVDTALIMAAPTPDFVPQVVPNPPEFDGDVSLLAVFKEGTDWVIVGATAKPEGGGSKSDNTFPTVWRSSDQGSTWSHKVLSVKGSSDTPLSSFTMAPDGSWNLFGESYPNSGDQQFNAAWIRSTDSGASFELMYPSKFRKIHDQGSSSGVFSASGAIAIDGWDEVVDSGDEDISVVWAAPAGEAITQIGDPKIPVQGGTPPGEFEQGLLWNNDTLVMWGSKDGKFPMSEVQFWAFDGSQFVPGTTLSGDGGVVGLSKVLSSADRVLLFGFTGKDSEQHDLAIWVGSFAQ